MMRYLLIGMVFLLFPLLGRSQGVNLAKNYFEQGEYVKAESVYKKLYQKQNRNFTLLQGLVSSLQEQEKYREAGKILQGFAKRRSNYPGINVEIGHNYRLQGDKDKAQEFYNKATTYTESHPNNAYRTGKAFQKYGLLPEAVETYKAALRNRTNPHFTIQLAQIYGEQGKLDKMFATFLDLAKDNDKYYYTINRYFSRYVESDPENKANKILRKTLLKRIQKDPLLFYNKLLSWLYVQEDNLKNAFIQEKAIYQRSDHKNLSNMIKLGRLAAEKNVYDVAEDIFNYAVDQAQTKDQQVQSYLELMKVKTKESSPKNYDKIDREYHQLFKKYGKGSNTLKLQLQYADFLAFKQQKTQQAKNLLNKALQDKISRFEEANLKMKIADILVVEEKFNQALIYYSQIKDLVKNSSLAEEATYKVARTSYYKGDFDWAQTQLKILKESTSELTANDALALNLLIEENKSLDSTQTALKHFAKADLLAVQEKNKEALSLLNTILTQHKGEKIEDEALLRSAKLYEKSGEYKEAEKAYQKIIAYYADDILADDAYYYLAELYRTKLDDPEKAMENYKQIIFNHADSIFFVDARKKFRKLRGDDIP